MSAKIQPIYLSHAQLFTYDQNDSKQWAPIHPAPIPTSIMFDSTRGLYRLISVDNSCKSVIANSTITADLEFHKTSARFGHWTDQANGTVYGIGFKTEQQLQDFSDCIKKAKAAFTGTRNAGDYYSVPNLPKSGEFQSVENRGLEERIGKLVGTDLNNEILRLKRENDDIKKELKENLSKYKVFERELHLLRQENEALLNNFEKLSGLIDSKRGSNEEIQMQCDYMRDQYLSNSSQLKGYKTLEEEYLQLLREKEGLEVVSKQERGDGGGGPKGTEGLQEGIQAVDELFNKAINELSEIHGEVRRAFLQCKDNYGIN